MDVMNKFYRNVMDILDKFYEKCYKKFLISLIKLLKEFYGNAEDVL